MAYRRSDRLLAVAKFILKYKVCAQFWVDGPDGRRMPLELSLLMTLKHPNIVSHHQPKEIGLPQGSPNRPAPATLTRSPQHLVGGLLTLHLLVEQSDKSVE